MAGVIACAPHAQTSLLTTATRRQRCRGLTLTECLVAVSTATTLAVMAAPTVNDMMDSVQQREVIGSLHDAMLLARSEAIKTNGRVVICRSVDGRSCAPAGPWEQGWIIFRDANNDAQLSADEVVLDSHGAVRKGWRLLVNQPFASYVSFKPDGRAAYRSGAFQAGSFMVCRDKAGPVAARQLVLSSSGRPRVERVNTPACAIA